MTIAKKIESVLEKSSWIRKMFEEGARLKAEHGADKVFDFSLGNPNLDPPESFRTALKDTVEVYTPGDHAYMPNVGYPHVRKAVAEYLSGEHPVQISENEVIMTCGAAGGLNIILKTLLDPGDEVITPSPGFVEYGFYADNHNGVLKNVPTKSDFTLDLEAFSSAISGKTKAVLINSPNNPTGQVYSRESLIALGALLKEKSIRLNRTVYLISDEPYRKIVYEGVSVPSIFECYTESILTTSYSKDISIPGERIGYVAVHPGASCRTDLMDGMSFSNRVLGFVNAPALIQRVVASIQGEHVDISAYARKRKLLCSGLSECGYDFISPAGAFYLFCKSPIPDDVAFVRMLLDEMILAVPGSGFGGPGHFRIAFCVDDDTIVNAMPGFRRAMETAKHKIVI